MQRFIKIIVACFFLNISQLEAQIKRVSFSRDTISIVPRPPLASPLSLSRMAPLKAGFHLSPSYTVSNFAFFCRQEWIWEKKTRIPLRFRLGSLEQANRLEGK